MDRLLHFPGREELPTGVQEGGHWVAVVQSRCFAWRTERGDVGRVAVTSMRRFFALHAVGETREAMTEGMLREQQEKQQVLYQMSSGRSRAKTRVGTGAGAGTGWRGEAGPRSAGRGIRDRLREVKRKTITVNIICNINPQVNSVRTQARPLECGHIALCILYIFFIERITAVSRNVYIVKNFIAP